MVKNSDSWRSDSIEGEEEKMKLLRASVFLKRHHTFPRQRLELAAAQFTYRASPEYGFS